MISKGLYGKQHLDIQVREHELAPAGDDRVIVKVHACGVCGTDLHFVGEWTDEHVALGHEIAAEVLEVGRNVVGLAPGDRVIIEDVSMCGVCEDCKSGHPEFCRNLFSIEGQPGMGQYMSVRYNSCVKFEGLDYVSACLTEPLAVSLTSVINADIPLGGSVLVLGPGPLGLMAAQLAKLRGAGFVAITGLAADNPREKARLAAAPEFGCDMVIEIGKQDVEEEIKRRFPKGVDRVIVSAPPKSLPDALKVIRYGGLITFFGIHLGGQSTVQHRHQRPDLPQDHPGADLCRARDQLPDLEPAIERRAGGCLEDRDPHLRLRRCRGHDYGQRGRQPADHQGGHAAERVGAC